MKEQDKILLKDLLTQIKIELVATTARPAALKQNTTTYNTLAQKIENWQKRLKIISNNANRQQSAQSLRSQNIHNLPPQHRHSEQQSINDNLKNVDEIKRLIEKAEQAISELLLNALNPTEAETLFNAIKQLKTLKDWNQKLTKLTDIANTTHDAETTTLVQEVTALQRHNQSNARTSPGVMPVQSMLLIIMVLLTLTQKTLRQIKN